MQHPGALSNPPRHSDVSQPAGNHHENQGEQMHPFLAQHLDTAYNRPASRADAVARGEQLRAGAAEWDRITMAPHEHAVRHAEHMLAQARGELQNLYETRAWEQAYARRELRDNTSLTDEQRSRLAQIAEHSKNPDLFDREHARLQSAVEEAQRTRDEAVQTRDNALQQLATGRDEVERVAGLLEDAAASRFRRTFGRRDAREELQGRQIAAVIRELQARSGAAPQPAPEALRGPVLPRGPEALRGPEVPPRGPEAPVRPEPSLIDNPTATLPQGAYGARQNGQYAEIHGTPLREIYAETNQLYTHLRREPHDTIARERFEILQSALEGVPGDTAFARIEALTNRLRNPDGLSAEQQQWMEQRWDQLRDALRATPEQVHELYAPLEAGVLAREIGNLRPEEDRRWALVNSALDGSIPGATVSEQIAALFERLRPSDNPFATNEQQAELDRLGQLRLALHASPEDIANMQLPENANEMIDVIHEINENPVRREAMEQVLSDVEGSTPEEKARKLDEDRKNNDPTGMRAQRKWMLLMGVQQAAQGIIQGLFSFTPPQS